MNPRRHRFRVAYHSPGFRDGGEEQTGTAQVRAYSQEELICAG